MPSRKTTVTIAAGLALVCGLPTLNPAVAGAAPQARLVYSEWSGGQFDLVIHDLATDQRTTVDTGGNDRAPDWGNRDIITFASDAPHPGAAGYSGYEIYAWGTSAPRPVRLTHNDSMDYWPSVSPQSSQVVYTESDAGGRRQIATVDAATGGDRRSLTTDGNNWNPMFSGDGRSIAFITDRLGGSALYLMNPDGSDERLVYHSPTVPLGGPSFAGSRILFNEIRDGVGDLAAVSVTGADYRRLTATPDVDELTPDQAEEDDRLAYSRNTAGAQRIAYQSADGSRLRILNPGGHHAENPSWERLAGPDSTGPVIAISSPDRSGRSYARGAVSRLSGSANDPSGIGVVDIAAKRTNGRGCRHVQADGTVGGRADCRFRDLEVSVSDGPWSMPVALTRGSYRLRVTAVDALGNITVQRRPFSVR